MSSAGDATTLEAYKHNREGVKHFEKKAYFPAYQSFQKALADDPLNAEVQLNLALTFETNEEHEKAEKAYKGALKFLPQDSTRRFEALFNLGGVLAKNKKIDEALAAYQAALDMDPDSLEVKTNIELLWQGGGGGGGGDQNQEQQQDQKGQNQQDQKDPQQQQQPQQQKKNQPKPFSSQELSQDDVKRILDEIKNQEQNIRAQEYEKGQKDSPKARDW